MRIPPSWRAAAAAFAPRPCVGSGPSDMLRDPAQPWFGKGTRK